MFVSVTKVSGLVLVSVSELVFVLLLVSMFVFVLGQ